MVKFVFFPLETKKTTFFAENFKIQGGQTPLPPFLRPCLEAPSEDQIRKLAVLCSDSIEHCSMTKGIVIIRASVFLERRENNVIENRSMIWPVGKHKKYF